MQKTILTALALVASTAAYAGDLPSRKTAPLPPTDRPAVELPYYVGGNVGGDIGGQGAFSGGAVAGWTPFRFLSVEGAYDFQYPNSSNYMGTGKTDYKNQLTISALPQYTFNSVPFTAYALAGVGYSWNNVTRSGAIYQVGGGVKYNVARNWDIDARYRYVNSFNESVNSAKPENRLTLGVNYRF